MTVDSQNGDRALSVIAHASFWALPILLPFALYVAFRQRRPWVAAHAAEAFNFQFSFGMIGVALFAVTAIAGTLGALAIALLLGLWLLATVNAISGLAAAANDTLKPYSGPVVRLLRRPPLQRAAA
jgi:uncharacterized Tic20 family protein